MTEQLNMKIVERIRKLLALAEDGGATEAEAALAAEKARELMAANGLSTAMVEAAGGQGEARASVELAGKADKWWQPPLIEAICETCFVHVDRRYRTDRGGRTLGAGYRMIGRESGVATAQVLFDYLCATVERATRETPNLAKPKWFQRAMSERLQERIRERHERAMQEQARAARERNTAAQHPSAAPGTALVVVLEDYAQKERDLNADARRGVPPGTTARERDEAAQRVEQRRREYEQRHAAALAAGHSEDVAYYLASGWSLERAIELAAPRPEETETQKRRRREKEDRENQRQREKHWERYSREEKKRSSHEWTSGRSAAEKVGLDPQVSRKSNKQIG